MLKKITPILFISFIYILPGKSQTVHKAEDLYKISHGSFLRYEVSPLKEKVQDKDYSGLLNESGMIKIDTGSKVKITSVKRSKAADSAWNTAEYAFNDDKDYKAARQMYKTVLEIQPDYYPASVKTAKCFEAEENYEKAETAYKQAIAKNFIDYQTHWSLADAYHKDAKYDEAVTEITIASVLDRNDTAILSDMKEIYLDAHLKFDYWVFTPQYQLSKKSNSREVAVMTKPDWEGYAMAKAIWQYEPGYAVSQGEKPGKPSYFEEKECLLNLLAGQDKHIDAELIKPINVLKVAQDLKLLDGFIYYEILLPQNPSMVYELPSNVIRSIKNYVILGHGGEGPKKK